MESSELAGMDALDLARLQFAFTMACHIVFPAFSIGLASYLAVLEGLWLATGRDVYLQVYKYWLRIFAVVFGMGVVSGIVMSYQFGTNWSVYADKTGAVIGPLMGYEVLMAFFLEAGFLGIMLFGVRRVRRGLHFTATVLVAVGTLFSAFWILSANSWMQTPAGYAVNDVGQFVPEDWWKVVFNPSFPYRLVHMVLAAYLTTAFAIGAVGAWHLLRAPTNAPAGVMFSMALWMAVLVAPLQLVAGDQHGLNTLAHQPAKIAAMEGHFDGHGSVPLILFGLPDMAAAETKFAVAIPHLGSLILTHSWNGEVKGLAAWPRTEWPNVVILFFSFRIMVGIGFAMIGLGLWSLWHRWRGSLFAARSLQFAAVLMGPAGFVALLAGWFVTEAGRQPYTVYGLLRTADSVSPLAAPAVASSVAAFAIVYFAVFGTGIFYLVRMAGTPPQLHEPEMQAGVPTRSAAITPAPVLARALAPDASS
jgi:cytochrome d ubiquinol oxidase subunit I